MRLTAKKRADLYHKIYVYKKRIEALKPNSVSNGLTYIERKRRLQWRITSWESQIKKIDESKSPAIKNIAEKVGQFIGYSVKGSKKMAIGRKLFYRWGLENGIQGSLLSQYTGSTRNRTAAEVRIRFIRSLSTNPKDKDLWERFKIFMNEPSN